MNIAYLLKPKAETTFLYEDNSGRQAVEKMKMDSHTAVPVISRDGRYLYTISEGDILRFILKASENPEKKINLFFLENVYVKDMRGTSKNPPCLITASPESLVFRAMEQNFIPVVDDWGSFIGIVTRKDILKYLATSQDRTV